LVRPAGEAWNLGGPEKGPRGPFSCLGGRGGIYWGVEIEIIVDNRVRVVGTGQLARDVVSGLKSEFEHDNPEWTKKRRLGLPTWSEPKTLRTWREEGSQLSFPRGGLARVTRVLREAGIDAKVRDARQYGVAVEMPEFRRELYPYQREIVERAIEREQCIIRAATGGGKTSALLAIAAEVSVPTLVVVHSQALMDQWKARAVSELGLRPKQIGIVQGKKFDLRPFTITIQKTMARVAAESKEVRDYFGCVIGDEIHLFAANSFFACIDPFPARYRIGASADHRRKDRKEFLIHDLFGDVAADVSRAQLVGSGHILEVEIRVVPTDFAAPWYGIPDGPEDERQLDFVRLVKEMAGDPERNFAAVRIVRSEVASGEQVLVMAHEREHCMRLGQTLTAMGIRAGYLLGGQESASEFAKTLEGLKRGTVQVGVGTYKAIGTGIDLPGVGVAVGVTPISSNEQFFGQVRGRVCRTAKGKTAARLYVLLDEHVYPTHLKNIVKWNTSVVVRDSVGDWLPVEAYLRTAR